MKSPMSNPNGEMPEPIPGASLSAELPNYKLRSDVPMGESLQGERVSGDIKTPYENDTTIKMLRGPKNP